jgi:hypothetical protein
MKRTRPNPKYEYRGEWLTLAELAEKYGQSSLLLYQRLVKHKWPVDRAMEQPLMSPSDRGRAGRRAWEARNLGVTT